MSNQKVVILAGNHLSTWYAYNYLKEDFEIAGILLEGGGTGRGKLTGKWKFIKRRIKRLGLFKVIGQILFSVFCVPILNKQSQARQKEIIKDLRLDSARPGESLVTTIGSVNSELCREKLKAIDPAVILVNGTGIIGKKTLTCTKAVFINTHVGITPEYRGVHGGYWALAQNDPDNCGVTVHLVDTGIDTGEILYQVKIKPGKQDNFVTYPLLQIGAALPCIAKALKDALRGELKPYKKAGSKSKLWYHPTLFYYLKHRWLNRVK